MQELLERRPILRSRDVEETRAFLAARAIRFELEGPQRAGFDVRYNGVYLRGLWLGYIRYGARAVTRVEPARGDYWVHLPLSGRMDLSAGRHAYACDPTRAALTSPLEVQVLRHDPQTARLCVSIQGEALTRHLAAMLGDEPAAPLRLDTAMRLTEGFGRTFAHLLRRWADELDRGTTPPGELAGGGIEQAVMTGLLLSQPHNYSEALRRCRGRAASRDVRRAVDYIREHAAEAVTLADLARESGVAGRTLLKHFRETHGVSPMRYLREHRLRRARESLQRPDAPSVSEAAARWGFAHLGRFAAEYRAQFGESPSCTLARARRA